MRSGDGRAARGLRARSKAGSLVFGGSLLFFLSLLTAELLYPGYSAADNYISDLGVGPSPSDIIFNAAVFLFGLLEALAAVLLYRSEKERTFPLLLMVAAAGAMGVGIFPSNVQLFHSIAALFAFGGGALAAVFSYRIVGRPVGNAGMVLGAISLVALALFASGTHLGLGEGGMERMALYPFLFWMAGVGAMLMRDGDVTAPVR